MSETIQISEEQGEEFVEGDGFTLDGHTYFRLTEVPDYEDHRWCDTSLFVFRRDDMKLFGIKYDFGSTESQESGFIYNEPHLVELSEQVVTTTVYKEA